MSIMLSLRRITKAHFRTGLTLLFITLAFISAAVSAVTHTTLQLSIGTQKSYQSTQAISRAAIGDPAIADINVINDKALLITPKQVGTTNLTIWKKGQKQAEEIELHVAIDTKTAARQLQELDANNLTIEEAGDQLILSGKADSLTQHDAVSKALSIDDKTGIDRSTLAFASQVQIDIKIVEISKDKLQSAGFFLGKNNGIARAISAPGNISGVQSGDSGGFSLQSSNGFLPRSDAFNFIYGRASNGLLGIVSLLEGNGFAYTLAQPSLVAMSGQTAHFLAGGEFPVPVRGGSGTDTSVTIEYKEFGVRLSLTPTVLDTSRIALKVAPEVSDLDFNAGIQSGGVTVPALRVRRTDTTISLGDGESFVISGLISQNTISNVDKLPGLGDIPIIGSFFQSKQLDRNDRELMMIVTPHLVNAFAKDAKLPELPGEQYRNYNPDYIDFLFKETGDFNSQQPRATGFSR